MMEITLRRAARVLGIVVVGSLLSGLLFLVTASAQPTASAPASSPPATTTRPSSLGREAWRATMARTPLPKTDTVPLSRSARGGAQAGEPSSPQGDYLREFHRNDYLA